jgi:hypothetical protein
MRYLFLLFLCFASPTALVHAQTVDASKKELAAQADAADVDGDVPSEPPKKIELPVGVMTPRATRLCSPDNPRIGTEVSCVVSVAHSQAFSVSINVPPGFSAAEQSAAELDEQTGNLTTTREVAVTPMSMRKLKLFGFSIAWSHETGAKGNIKIEDAYMSMASMMGDVDEPMFRTFRSPTPDFKSFWNRHGALPLIETNWYLMIGLMTLVLGGVLSMVIVYVQNLRERRRQAAIPWVDPRPAHVIANESLETLAVDSLPEKGMVLEFYLRLSEILRVFLENRFGIAIERGRGVDGQVIGLRFTAATAQEIETVLTGHPDMTAEGFTALMECLGIIDYVVFGGMRPHVGQTEADRRRIRFCIELNRALEIELPATLNATEPDDKTALVTAELETESGTPAIELDAASKNRLETTPESLSDHKSIDPGAEQ